MFLKKCSSYKIIVSIFLVSIFVFSLGGFLKAEKALEKKEQQKVEKLTVLKPDSLKYGDKVHILNGYAVWNGGYLDTRGTGSECEGNYICVSTARGYDRAHGSGTWKIISAKGKPEGSNVMAFDDIYLQNQWQGNGGYLDTRGTGCEGNDLCVSTSKKSNRDNGSGTWKIIPESCSNNCVILEDQALRLLNGYNNFNGGFLDTRGVGCEKNYLCVSTSTYWNRDRLSTCWKMKKSISSKK